MRLSGGLTIDTGMRLKNVLTKATSANLLSVQGLLANRVDDSCEFCWGFVGDCRLFPMVRGRGLAVIPAVLWFLAPLAQGQTLKLSATLTIEKSDDKTKTNEQIQQLLSHAKQMKYEGNVQRFLENMVVQMHKVIETAKVVEEKKSTEIPKDFTPPKYRVKAMPKLNAKKITVKKMTAADLAKRLEEGKDFNFKEPMLITNATGLFSPGAWDEVRRYWTATRLMEDSHLEKEFRVEYWPQDKARARPLGWGLALVRSKLQI